jgi:hypothetical protein
MKKATLMRFTYRLILIAVFTSCGLLNAATVIREMTQLSMEEVFTLIEFRRSTESTSPQIAAPWDAGALIPSTTSYGWGATLTETRVYSSTGYVSVNNAGLGSPDRNTVMRIDLSNYSASAVTLGFVAPGQNRITIGYGDAQRVETAEVDVSDWFSVAGFRVTDTDTRLRWVDISGVDSVAHVALFNLPPVDSSTSPIPEPSTLFTAVPILLLCLRRLVPSRRVVRVRSHG